MKSTKEESSLRELRSINLKLPQRLRDDQEFRREWFRAELESSVPEAFRELRERRGMTQGDLAREMGTKQPAVSRFERSTSPTWEFDFLLRAAEALNGRLRVVIEAAEDVIVEYEDRPSKDRQSILSANAETAPLKQTVRQSAASAQSVKDQNDGIEKRGERQTNRPDDRGHTGGSAISA